MLIHPWARHPTIPYGEQVHVGVVAEWIALLEPLVMMDVEFLELEALVAYSVVPIRNTRSRSFGMWVPTSSTSTHSHSVLVLVLVLMLTLMPFENIEHKLSLAVQSLRRMLVPS